MDHLPEVLTAQNIADYLQINVRRIYDQFQLKEAAGGIPHYTVGKQKRVDKADFIKWKESSKQAKADRTY
ncbi:helix-turn-helix domain-containing protein [Paenibacillus sp. S3N08]|uniref:Helix-turn-helix domain-containing protein n=1 Tax=Paenibacillus agricola TaxID=2716264 RepID=A0ABX0JH04_9BACL|nr:helix-turn-helix domain-containing protein [Paenibacillus agricola]